MTERPSTATAVPGLGPPPRRGATREPAAEPFEAVFKLQSARTADAEGAKPRAGDSAQGGKDDASASPSESRDAAAGMERDAAGTAEAAEPVRTPPSRVPAPAAQPSASPMAAPEAGVAADVASPRPAGVATPADGVPEGPPGGPGQAPAATPQPAGAAPAPDAAFSRPPAGGQAPADAGPEEHPVPSRPAVPSPGAEGSAPSAQESAEAESQAGERPAAPVRRDGGGERPARPLPAGFGAEVVQAERDGDARRAVARELRGAGEQPVHEDGPAPGRSAEAAARTMAAPARPVTAPDASAQQPAPSTAPAAGTGVRGDAAPAAGPAPGGIRLSQAVETVRTLLQMGVSAGVSHARISLSPAELGHVNVRLRSTAAGVSAQITAQAPEAAQMLQQAADDLRRSLEEQGLTVIRIDVNVAGEERTARGAFGDTGDGVSGGAAEGGDEPAAAADEEERPVRLLELANGVLVDVLA